LIFTTDIFGCNATVAYIFDSHLTPADARGNLAIICLICVLMLLLQHIEVLTYVEKQRRLESILRSQDQGSKIIIFCSTKKMCDQLARNLTRQFGAAAIHGDKSQADRDHVLNQFRSGRTPVLVATDVAARGLDVKDIRWLTISVIYIYIYIYIFSLFF